MISLISQCSISSMSCHSKRETELIFQMLKLYPKSFKRYLLLRRKNEAYVDPSTKNKKKQKKQ